MHGDAAVALLRAMGHSGTVPGAILAADLPAALAQPAALASRSRPGRAPVASRAARRRARTRTRSAQPPVTLRMRAVPLHRHDRDGDRARLRPDVGARLARDATRVCPAALPGLALLLLAAHFFRAGLMPLTVLCVAAGGAAVRARDLGGACCRSHSRSGRWNGCARPGCSPPRGRPRASPTAAARRSWARWPPSRRSRHGCCRGADHVPERPEEFR